MVEKLSVPAIHCRCTFYCNLREKKSPKMATESVYIVLQTQNTFLI